VGTTLTAALKGLPKEEAAGIPAEMFDEIIRQHQRRVYRVIFLLLRDADAADTLTQECFLRAYQSRDSFRGECRVETWLLRIAVNLVRDHGKNRRVSFWKRLVGLDHDEDGAGVATTVAAPQPSAERVLLAREELNAVWTVVSSLPEQQRTIFLLRFAEEMPLAEIGETLGISVGAVKAQLCRATGKVRDAVKDKSC
jgi:RNA polymerase sigma-70 factor (ECF subfamily)